MKAALTKSVLGLASFLVVGASATFGSWGHATYAGTYSTVVNVPSAGSANQQAAAFGQNGAVSNFGPLGNYYLSVGQSLNVSGAIGAGNYNIYQSVYSSPTASGYSATSLNW